MSDPMVFELTPEEWDARREEWLAVGLGFVAVLASQPHPFSFDMVRQEMEEAGLVPLHSSWWGVLMRRREVRALVVPLGCRPSRIRSRRGGWSQVYVGREFA